MNNWYTPSMFWTTEKTQQLTELWGKGLLAKEIAETLGCTRNAVLGKAHRLNLPLKRDEAAVTRKPRPPQTKKKGNFSPLPFTERKDPKRPDLRHAAPEGVAVGALEEVYARHPHTGCRWIYGDPATPEFGLCPNKQEPGRSWCAEHLAIVFVKATPDAA